LIPSTPATAFGPMRVPRAAKRDEHPKFSKSQCSAEGFDVQWQGAPGVTCLLDASTNLVEWTTLISSNPSDGMGIFIDADSLVMPRRFYRPTPQ
jgi:hypothetical protein